jgi:acetyl-CoA C-acetyltransferase
VSERPAFLLGGARTPVGRYQGALAAYSAVELGGFAVAAARECIRGVEPQLAVFGNVLQGGSGQNPARQAAVRGGVATTVPALTLNDVCLASMSAVALAATHVSTGRIDVALVGGFESMSNAPHLARVRRVGRPGDIALVDMMVVDGLHCAIDDVGMGELSDAENARLGIGREQQDVFALTSHRRGAAAASAERLDQVVEVGDLRQDEGVRVDTDLEKLAMLRPAFTPKGTITAGNASQLADAGAAGFIGSRGAGEPLAEIVDWHVVAGPDSSLHLKPALAIRALLDRHGLTSGDVALWEINEAFAGVVLATIAELGLDHERVNVNGGAIAIGHPLGASGFRLVLDLAYELRRRRAELGVAAICGGGGQGEAMLLRACPA